MLPLNHYVQVLLGNKHIFSKEQIDQQDHFLKFQKKWHWNPKFYFAWCKCYLWIIMCKFFLEINIFFPRNKFISRIISQNFRRNEFNNHLLNLSEISCIASLPISDCPRIALCTFEKMCVRDPIYFFIFCDVNAFFQSLCANSSSK